MQDLKSTLPSTFCLCNGCCIKGRPVRRITNGLNSHLGSLNRDPMHAGIVLK